MSLAIEEPMPGGFLWSLRAIRGIWVDTAVAGLIVRLSVGQDMRTDDKFMLTRKISASRDVFDRLEMKL